MRRFLLLFALVLSWCEQHASAQDTTPAASEMAARVGNFPAQAPMLAVGKETVGVIGASHPTVETETLKGYGETVRGALYRAGITQPGPYHVELRSYFFDAYLVVRDSTGAIVAEDDDGLLRTHARATFESKDATATYIVEACALHGGVGAFELKLIRGKPEELVGASRRAAAVADAKRGIEVVKAKTGAEHPDYAASLNSLAVLYESMGQYEEAEPLYLQALEIRKQALGEEHSDYATSLNNLALLNYRMGAYEKAEPWFLEARDIYRRVLGDQHPDYATSLNNLAWLYLNMGTYEKAEPLFLEARDIWKEVLGEEHPDYATSLNNLGVLYYRMGAYEKAEPLYLEARDIWLQALGDQHPRYASSLHNLAYLYEAMGDYDKAETLYLAARRIRKEVLGENHPRYATTLNKLAVLYYRVGAYEKAEPLYLEAREIRRETLGEHHPRYAAGLSDLAGLYESMGAHEKAEPLFLEARDIYKEVLGEQHPDYAWSLHNLAGVYKHMGKYEKAMPLHEQAIAITQASLEQAAVVLTEARQVAMASSRRFHIHNYIDTATHIGGAAASAFAVELAWKGSILVRQCNYRQVADQPEIAPLFQELQQVSRTLASTARDVPEVDDIDAWKDQLADLEAEKEQLVRELTNKSAAFQAARQRVTVEQLVAALPDDAALVDYVVLDLLEGRRDAYSKLVAFVVRKDASVTLHDLGALEPLEAAIGAWRVGGFGRSPEAQRAGALLRAALWQPLLPRIENAGLVLVATDGVLGQLALPALPGREDDRYLLEEHRIALMPVPQLLPAVVSRRDKTEAAAGLLVMGGVEYDAAPVQLAAAAPQGSPHHNLKVDSELRAGAFSNEIQANTLAEIALIGEIFEAAFRGAVVTLKEAAATEERFRRDAPGCSYIHLATHGFFAAPSVESAAQAQNRKVRGPIYQEQEQHVERVSAYLLSGLAFAGANRPSQWDGDDGILTAEEIAFLPLNGAELVCLSACETGLGKVAGGEGLLGLQRAFQISGARSTVASLWKVSDLATRLLMERFYRNLWEKGMSRLDGLREAQLWLLKNPEELESVRSVSGITLAGNDHADRTYDGRAAPEYWAAFQLSGDWR